MGLRAKVQVSQYALIQGSRILLPIIAHAGTASTALLRALSLPAEYSEYRLDGVTLYVNSS